MKPYLEAGQSVNFVDANGKTHKGTIAHVYNEDSARITLANGSAIAGHSDGKESGTFHFPSDNRPAEEASPKAGK